MGLSEFPFVYSLPARDMRVEGLGHLDKIAFVRIALLKTRGAQYLLTNEFSLINHRRVLTSLKVCSLQQFYLAFRDVLGEGHDSSNNQGIKEAINITIDDSGGDVVRF